MNNIEKLKNAGFTICCYIQRGAKLSDKQNSFVNEILSNIENDINLLSDFEFNALFKQFRHGIDDDLFSKLKDTSILNYLNLKGVKNSEYLRYCNFSFDEDEYVPKEVVINSDIKDDKVLKLLENIKLACKKASVCRSTITYINKDTDDLTNIPKSRFTGEYPIFMVSAENFDRNFYFILDQDYQSIKDILYYGSEDYYELYDDYHFYEKDEDDDEDYEENDDTKLI